MPTEADSLFLWTAEDQAPVGLRVRYGRYTGRVTGRIVSPELVGCWWGLQVEGWFGRGVYHRGAPEPGEVAMVLAVKPEELSATEQLPWKEAVDG